MNKNLRKAKLVGVAFLNGFEHAAIDEDNLSIAGFVGLYQGLKYNGNLKRGITSGLVTLAVFSTIDGVRTVTKNWKTIMDSNEENEEE